MKDKAPLKGLAALSEAEKDELIASLWKDLSEERARAQLLHRQLAQLADKSVAAAADARPLLAELRARGTSKRGAAKRAPNSLYRLGGGLRFLRPGAMVATALIAGLLLSLDYGVGRFQAYSAKQKRLAQLALERAAYTSLFVELVNVAYEPDRSGYRLTMAMQSLDPRHPIYVMLNPIRVFEQSGLVWKEVPARTPRDSASGVVKLTGRRLYQTIFTPNVKDWAELMPGYMHIRFDNDMLISLRSEPDEDIVARKDPYYVFLKPLDADDDAIRKQMNYSGDPPLYITMPPH